MQVSKWGNSLAVRLPAELVAELGLKAGDDIELLAMDYAGHLLGVSRELTKEDAIVELRKLRGMVPRGFKFDREEAHERPHRIR